MTLNARRPLIVAIAVALAVALIGGALTDVGPWYQGLRKPALNPPNWLFAPAWTINYGLCVAAAVTGWAQARNNADKRGLAGLFVVNALLNVLWSALFFFTKRPDWALLEVVLLWLSVVVLMIFLGRFSKRAAAYLAPYMVWVGFAGYLNYAIVALNS